MNASTFKTEATTLDGASGVRSSRPSLPALVFAHPEPGACHLSKPRFTVGRSGSSDLQLPGSRVSRNHCVFTVDGERVAVADAGSRNGTYVNGEPARSAELVPGDVVRIGEWLGIFDRVSATDQLATLEVSPGVLAGPTLRRVLTSLEAVATTKLPIILNGESGSGKERLAQFVHQKSGRQGPFQGANCAAIPETLAESELFGHQKGAFTGADRARPGLFRSAEGGTLLLDEISDLPMQIQTKLLRVLEEECVVPLGSAEAVPVDVRVVVAGQKRLADLVATGHFRGDLFARLNGFEVEVPPLRKRREEVLPLFTSAFQRFSGLPAPKLTPEFAEALLLYSWPFNVRELVQMAHRVSALHRDVVELGMNHAPEELKRKSGAPSVPAISSTSPASLQRPEFDVDQIRAEGSMEQALALQRALEAHDGNVSRAAAALGISRGRAYRLLAIVKGK